MTSNDRRVPLWPGLRTARDLAAATGDRSVGTQHVLQALLRRADPYVVAVLAAGGVDETAVVAALSGIAGTGCRTGGVSPERVAVSPRVLALVRAADCPDADAVSDLQVLDALLVSDEPSLARRVLDVLGAHRRVLQALRAARTQVDDAGGDLVST